MAVVLAPGSCSISHVLQRNVQTIKLGLKFVQLLVEALKAGFHQISILIPIGPNEGGCRNGALPSRPIRAQLFGQLP